MSPDLVFLLRHASDFKSALHCLFHVPGRKRQTPPETLGHLAKDASDDRDANNDVEEREDLCG